MQKTRYNATEQNTTSEIDIKLSWILYINQTRGVITGKGGGGANKEEKGNYYYCYKYNVKYMYLSCVALKN